MEYTRLDAFTITGLTTRTRNRDEMDPDRGKIAPLWENLIREVETAGLQPLKTYGIYHNYQTGPNGEFNLMDGTFDLMAGVLGPFPAEDAGSVTVPPGSYAVFTQSGPPARAAAAAWKAAWEFFGRPQAPERTFAWDIEAYTGPENLTLYIGVKDAPAP